MNRRRIEASEIFSLPESASLDTMFGSYSDPVEAYMLNQGGELHLRIASSKSKDSEMSEEDVQKKIKEWKTHAKEHATSAGFRKANRGRRGPMDPRRFALQLAEAAKLNATRYRSPSLLRLAKKLRWVAEQERGVAARALAKIAQPLEEEAQRRDQAGMPIIQKPRDQVIPPQEEFNEESRLAPGEPIEYGHDESWKSHEASRMAKEKESDADLLTKARNFLQSYQSTNSLYDTDLLKQLQDQNVFAAWVQSLNDKGAEPDPDQLAEAWNAAMSEVAEGSGENLPDELGEEDLSLISAARGHETTIQEYAAPGGDWFNTVINMRENPVMDRYLRTMKDKREGRSRRARKIEVEDDIAAAVDQTLDHFAGDMLPSEISSDHVQEFVDDRFPDVSAAKVYEAIQKISDPKKRHEEDPKERTNQEAQRRSNRTALTGPVGSPLSYPEQQVLEEVEASPGGLSISAIKDRQALKALIQKGYLESYPGGKVRTLGSRSGELKRYREIAACCHGTGEKDGRCCGKCDGSGRADVSAFDSDLDRKAKIASRLGTLLLVSVDVGNRSVSPAARQELTRVVRTRVASKGKPIVLKHSTELMKTLVENNIPYRTASYRHPRYQR